jgi:glyoxylase-like metal-dependent hydrolase (beta-lactamase superfamily II)
MMQMSGTRELPPVREFQTAGGGRIFQIPLQEFPMLVGFAYVVLVHDEHFGDFRVLIDTGSGFGESNQHLEAGLQAASRLAGQPLGLESLTHVLITHGHIDHFGGLGYVRPRTTALVGVHELDLRNLTNYEERLAVVARRLGLFLIEAGVPADMRTQIIESYTITKRLYHSVKVDFTFEALGMHLGPFEMLHVPGHCAGHVVIRLHDVLFSGDHVLDETSPHQSPEHLTLSTGLEHYLRSLDALQAWMGDVRLSLGGHKDPIYDLSARIDAIRCLHLERLNRVEEFLATSHTVNEVSHNLFGDVHGYNVLLALEEAGAHVEYLYQRGRLGIANLEDYERSLEPLPVCYLRLKGGGVDTEE